MPNCDAAPFCSRFFGAHIYLPMSSRGYLTLDSIAATCLFQTISGRYEKGSIILISNKRVLRHSWAWLPELVATTDGVGRTWQVKPTVEMDAGQDGFPPSRISRRTEGRMRRLAGRAFRGDVSPVRPCTTPDGNGTARSPAPASLSAISIAAVLYKFLLRYTRACVRTSCIRIDRGKGRRVHQVS